MRLLDGKKKSLSKEHPKRLLDLYGVNLGTETSSQLAQDFLEIYETDYGKLERILAAKL